MNNVLAGIIIFGVLGLIVAGLLVAFGPMLSDDLDQWVTSTVFPSFKWSVAVLFGLSAFYAFYNSELYARLFQRKEEF